MLPFSRPRYGLSITANTLCWVEVSSGIRKSGIHRIEEHPLPSGLIHPSPLAPNVAKVDELAKIFKTSLPQRKHPCSIAVSLPDLCARTLVFELAQLPASSRERDALLRWKFKQDCHLHADQIRVTSQRYTPSRVPAPHTHQAHQPVHLLATALSHAVVEPYEQACLAAGLIPMTVGIASFLVFDFCRPVMIQAMATLKQDHTRGYHLVFFYVADWGCTTVIIHDNVPVFVRIKPLRPVPLSCSSSTGSPSPAISANSLDPEESNKYIARLTNELIATLQYYFELHQSLDQFIHPLPLFLAGSLDPATIFPQVKQRVETAFTDESRNAPRIQAIPLQAGLPYLSGKIGADPTCWTGTTLAALASTRITP
ncbi:MAG: hypothetical protein D6704_04570 [Nitrospirae bacterium]|nr:MAG: hypothetical protein D6704_04570 [Nitrospirota bacterium]